MPSVSDDFQMPIMYQDLRNPNMGMLGMPYPYFGSYTNYLGGIQMKPELKNDIVVFEKKKKDRWKTLKNVGLILAAITTGAFLKGKGVFGWIGKQCSGVTNWFKNLGKTSPAPAPAPAPAPPPPPAGVTP